MHLERIQLLTFTPSQRKRFQISYCFILQRSKEGIFSHSALDCSIVTFLLPSTKHSSGEINLFQLVIQSSGRMNSPWEAELCSVEEQVKLHSFEQVAVLWNLYDTSKKKYLLFNTCKTTYFLLHSAWNMLMNILTWLGARHQARKTPAPTVHNSNTSGIPRLIFQILHQKGCKSRGTCTHCVSSDSHQLWFYRRGQHQRNSAVFDPIQRRVTSSGLHQTVTDSSRLPCNMCVCMCLWG